MPLVQSVGRLWSAVGPVSTEVVECRWSSREVVDRRWSSREVVECRWSSQYGGC